MEATCDPVYLNATAVIGGGVIGLMAALKLSGVGDKVVLLDKVKGSLPKFQGELLHPIAIDIFSDLGLSHFLNKHRVTNLKGFRIVSKDVEPHIIVDHSDSKMSCVIDHQGLVADLLLEVHKNRDIQCKYINSLGLDKDKCVRFASENGETTECYKFSRIIGADGRNSTVRSTVAPTCNSSPEISKMLPLTLHGCNFHCGSRGHIFIGDYGSLLLYRVGENTFRCLVDVPSIVDGENVSIQGLLDNYHGILPCEVKHAFIQSLTNVDMKRDWLSINRLSRFTVKDPLITLIGDAAGYSHPLTATGITNGLLDVRALEQRANHINIHGHRISESLCADVFSQIIFTVFSKNTAANLSIKKSLGYCTRKSNACSEYALKIMCLEEPSLIRLGEFLSKIALHAIRMNIASFSLRNIKQLCTEIYQYFKYFYWVFKAFIQKFKLKLYLN